jgi:hypothetical protein
LSNGFIKQTLQLEGVNSLQIAVQRSIAIHEIQKKIVSLKKKENNFKNRFHFQKNKGHVEIEEDKKEQKRNFKNFHFKENRNLGCW